MEEIEEIAVERFSLKGRTFEAHVIDVYDGDTATVVFNPFPADPNSKLFAFKVRMLGYNSPEMRPRKTKFGRRKIIRKAKAAKQALSHLINDKDVVLTCSKFDAFGRILGTIYYNHIWVNEYMINQKHGVRI